MGRFLSGQKGRAVDALALCLRGFESLSAHKFMEELPNRGKGEANEAIKDRFFDLVDRIVQDAPGKSWEEGILVRIKTMRLENGGKIVLNKKYLSEGVLLDTNRPLIMILVMTPLSSLGVLRTKRYEYLPGGEITQFVFDKPLKEDLTEDEAQKATEKSVASQRAQRELGLHAVSGPEIEELIKLLEEAASK